MTVRRLYPTPAETVDLVEEYAYPGEPGTPWLRANMVASADGAAWADGHSTPLSSDADARLLVLLRVLSDVVLVGGRTTRVEGYGPARTRKQWRELRAGRPPAPPIAVVSASLDLDFTAPMFTETAPEARTIVLTTEDSPAEAREAAAEHADVIVAGAERVDMKAAVAALAERGLGRILCEGGPRLLAQVAAAGMLDELCLTVSPLLVGGDAARILNDVGLTGGPAGNGGTDGTAGNGGTAPYSLSSLRLAHVLEEGSYLFLRYLAR